MTSSRPRARSHTLRPIHLWAAASLATSLLMASAAAGSPDPGSGGLLVGLRLGSAARDLLSITDIRPVSRGEAVAEIEVDYLIGERWVAGVGGRFAGSWFDFSQAVSAANGNIKDQDLTIRGAVDRIVSRGSSLSTYVGLGVEYGQARSFTYTRLFNYEGPRTYYLGGLLRVGITHPVLSRLQLHGEIGQSVFRARSHDAALATDYHWLGRSLSMTLGVRVIVLRGGTGRE